MATFYVNPVSPINGDGSESSPYNAIPANTFTSGNTWKIKSGTTLNLGSTQHTIESNVSISSYGDGNTLPIITGNASNMLMIFSNDNVNIENVILQRLGSVGGNGINIGGGAAQNFSAQHCKFIGFGNHIYADKAQSLLLLDNDFIGGTIGIQASARDGINCTDWQIKQNRFNSNGTDILLRVSESTTYTAGSFINLEISENTFENSSLTAIQLNSAAYVFTGEISVTGPSTIVRSINWPSWPVGSQIFLTNFSNNANFGLFTVASISGTTLTVNETSLINESSSSGKQVWLWRSDRMFDTVVIYNNIIQQTGATPVLVDTVFRGNIYNNTIKSCIIAGVGAAGIETGNCEEIRIEKNTIIDMRTNVFDGMGIFLDNAVRNSVVIQNQIQDCLGATNDNSGAGVAVFNCIDNEIHSNIVSNCKRGVWIGGSGTSNNNIINNTFASCGIGVRINSSPVSLSNSIQNNVILNCTTGVSSNSSQIMTNNSEGSFSSLNLKQNYQPKEGSSLISSGLFLNVYADKKTNSFWNPPSIGAFEYIRPKTITSTRTMRS